MVMDRNKTVIYSIFGKQVEQTLKTNTTEIIKLM